MDDHAALDLDLVTQENRTIKLGIRGNLDVFAYPHIAADVPTQILSLDAMVEHVPASAHVFTNIPHIGPIATSHVAVQGATRFQQLRKDVLAPICGHTLLYEVQHRGIDHIDAGVHRIRDHFAPRWFFKELGDSAVGIGDDYAIFQGVGYAIESQGGLGAFCLVVGDNLLQVDVGHGVAADDEERLIEKFLGILDTTRRTQGRFLNCVMDLHAQAATIPKIALDHFGHEVEGDHNFCDALALEKIQDVAHHRFGNQRDHRFGATNGQWT